MEGFDLAVSSFMFKPPAWIMGERPERPNSPTLALKSMAARHGARPPGRNRRGFSCEAVLLKRWPSFFPVFHQICAWAVYVYDIAKQPFV